MTVALSGDAGDELFGGYNRYFWGPRIWRRLALLPYPARQVLSSTLAACQPRAGTAWLNHWAWCAPAKKRKLAARCAVVLPGPVISIATWCPEWQIRATRQGNETGRVLEPKPGLLADALLSAEGAKSWPSRMMYQDSA